MATINTGRVPEGALAPKEKPAVSAAGLGHTHKLRGAFDRICGVLSRLLALICSAGVVL